MKDGLLINTDNDEVLIKGSKDDLEELAEYIHKIANSKDEKDHLHLDDLTIISKESSICNLIIEKE